MAGLSGLRRRPTVLAVDLSQPVVDDAGTDPFARLTGDRRPRLRTLTQALADAAEDPRVAALLARVDHPARSWAHAEELRAAVAAFRRNGKPAIAHAQTFGEVGDATLAYYTAVAFDEVHLQPTGDWWVTGLAREVPFVAELLDKLDVDAEVDHRHEYKSAANLFTEREFTDAHREAVDRIVASHHEQLVAAVAAGRGVDRDDAAALIDRGPLRGAEALRAGLVDRLAYRDETTAEVKATAGAGAQLVSVRRYRARRSRWRRRPTVALIHGSGPILVGRSRRSLLGQTMGADTVVTGFQQAIRDKRVRAILFRVDSPGGSAVASDAIARAVVRARETGKPVVASMGPVAGSGGYWVSMEADRIVAAPGTLTGSIGVVYTKLVTGRLRQRLGVTRDEAHRGANALMFSPSEKLTDEQWGHISAWLDGLYDEFVDRVAQGRRLPRAEVEPIARGRVWTGADARERRLVDHCGGYLDALSDVRALIGVAPDVPLRLRTLPRKRLRERLGLRPPHPEDAAATLAPARQALRALGAFDAGAARVPDWTERLR